MIILHSAFSIALFIFSQAPHAIAAQTPTLVITAIVASAPSGQEWIEVYNTTSNELDIGSWRFVEGFTPGAQSGTRHKLGPHQGDSALAPYEYAVIAQDASAFLAKHSSFSNTVFDSSWSSLREGGERVQLIDAEGKVQEDFTYLPAEKGALKRLNPLSADYTSANWIVVQDYDTALHRLNAVDAAPSTAAAKQESAPSANTNKQARLTATSAPVQALHADAGKDRSALVGEKVNFDGSDSINPVNAALSYSWNFEDGERASGQTVTHKFLREGDYHVLLTISNGEDEDDDAAVVRVQENANLEKISAKPFLENTKPDKSTRPAHPQPQTDHRTAQGVVLVEPGIFAKNYFYISDSGATRKTLQVYSSSGDFPVLHTGQLIAASGATGLYHGIPRLRIKNALDIKILRGEDPPDPENVSLGKITDEYRGVFARIEGEVRKEDGKIFLRDTAGGESLRVEFKTATSISTAELKEGSIVEITGIIDATRTGLRLLPRFPGDIIVIKEPSKAEPKRDGSSPEVQGERTAPAPAPPISLDFTPVGETVIAPPAENEKRTAYKYLIATGIVLVATAIGLIVQERRKSRAAP